MDFLNFRYTYIHKIRRAKSNRTESFEPLRCHCTCAAFGMLATTTAVYHAHWTLSLLAFPELLDVKTESTNKIKHWCRYLQIFLFLKSEKERMGIKVTERETYNWGREEKRVRKREKIFHLPVHSRYGYKRQCCAWSPMWVAGNHTLKPASATFPGH